MSAAQASIFDADWGATHPPISRWPFHPVECDNPYACGNRSAALTIGIGVLCEGAECVVLASDTRGSWPRNRITPHEECGKQWDFPFFPVAACVAGTLSCAQPIVDELTVQIAKLAKEKKVYCEHFENAIDYARFRKFKRRVDWQMKRSLGVTHSQWIRGRIPAGQLDPLAVRAGMAILDGTTLPVQMIVAGFLKDGRLIFYKADQLAELEQATSPGVCVIGTGGEYAMDHLTWRGQNADCSLTRSLLHVYEALEKARSRDRYVGKASDYIIIHKNGQIDRFPANSDLLKGWKRAYKKRDSTVSLQRHAIANRQMELQLRQHVRRKSEFIQ